jgi:serine protease Do
MDSLVIARNPRPARRKGALSAFLVAGAVAAAPMVTPLPALARLAPEGFGDLIEQVSPAVVQISAKQVMTSESPAGTEKNSVPEHFRDGPFKDFFERYFNDRSPRKFQRPQGRRAAIGSGFIIDEDGIVVTNNHVIGSAKEITVTLKDGRELSAELLGSDEKTDLAVLRIETDTALPAVAWGDSDKARVGDWVLAVGNPFGLGGTATVGIVSARGRDIGAGPYDDFIQVDAPINSGNSGGPLFDQSGRVIGVNTAIYSPNGGNVGIGFAIPAELAKQVVAQLQEKGSVERGWLGIRIQPVTPEIAESLGLDEPEGALIASVNENSPAEKAGLRQGDVILGFDNEKIKDPRGRRDRRRQGRCRARRPRPDTRPTRRQGAFPLRPRRDPAGRGDRRSRLRLGRGGERPSPRGPDHPRQPEVGENPGRHHQGGRTGGTGQAQGGPAPRRAPG